MYKHPHPDVLQDDNKLLTMSNGCPIGDNRNSLTAGIFGPPVLQDFAYLDKLGHFDRERIPERVVHAKGMGAHGYFEVTADVTKYTRAAFLNKIGKKTPIFARFSLVVPSKGATDLNRDVRGFALKFYTEEGNFDLVGNNLPVFFFRDPILFPDFIHSQKPNPITDLRDANAAFDFLSKTPESVQQVAFLYSDRGIPKTYRNIDGFGVHTFKWVNDKGEVHYMKWHYKTDQGIENFTEEEADQMKGKDPNYHQRDLFEAIHKKNFPSWTMYVQIMTEEQAKNYKYNPFDVTKVWLHGDFPMIPIGKLVLDRNVSNFFAETEQVAFCPGHLVPGIEPSPDKMFQGRIFSYKDTHHHRVGANSTHLPINAPRNVVANGMRDGAMNYYSQTNRPHYDSDSNGGPKPDPQYKQSAYKIEGVVDRIELTKVVDTLDYEQPRIFWEKVLKPEKRELLIHNMAIHLCFAKKEIRDQIVENYTKVHPDWGKKLSEALDIEVAKIDK